MSIYKGKTLLSGCEPLNEELLNKTINEKLEKEYYIGRAIITNENVSPAEKLGFGTWELSQVYNGGELIAYGTVEAEGSSTEMMLKDNYYPFSDDGTLGSSKKYMTTNYIDNILVGNSGTIKVNTKGIVGLVECDVFISGISKDSTTYGGIWWGNNSNELPEGVSIFPSDRKPITIGWSNGGYGGTNMKYIYKVDSVDDLSFFVNPLLAPYNHNLMTNSGGVGSYLSIKAYAKYGTSYLWKRID